MKKFISFLVFFASFLYAESKPSVQDFTLLSNDELKTLSQAVQKDIFDSDFFKDINTPQVIAISDFSNLTHFSLDIQTLARLVLTDLRDSGKFNLTNAISGNALNADPLIDKIRQLRNNEEFKDIIPKNSLLAPTYSLSARISDSIINTDPKVNQSTQKVRAELSFVFSITNLKTGLVEWDYITHITKDTLLETSYKSLSEYACLHDERFGTLDIKEACEMAIIELWNGNFANIPAHKLEDFMLYVNKAIRHNSALGLRALGVSYRLGVGSKQDDMLALDSFLKACTMEDGGSCYNLGLMYKNGLGIAQSFAKAQEFLSKACKLKYNEACELSTQIEGRLDDESLESMHPTIRAATEECLNDKSYRKLSHGRVYIGEVYNPNHKLTNDQRGESCVRLGFHYWHGIEGYTPKNRSKAMSAYLRACDVFNYADGCYQYALQKMLGHASASDVQTALKYSLKGCKLGNMYACLDLGHLYERGANSIEIDSQKALKYHKMACDGGVQIACDFYESLRQNIR